MDTRMSTDDREALVQAIVELTAERGYNGLSVAAISRRAGVSHYRFAEHFESVQDCYLRTFEDQARRFESEVLAAFDADPGAAWRVRLRAAAYAAASFVDRDPATARFATVATPGAGEDAQRLRDAQTQRLVGLLDAGRSELADPDSLGRGHAEVLFGGIYQMLVSGLVRGERRPAVSFVPELMYLAVLPYLGHAAAREELETPAPAL
jgi:AcrR family transcriptional regulator